MRVVLTIAFGALSSVGAAEQMSLEPPMVSIEGGTYPIGSLDGPASARPAHKAMLDAFVIDATEVTNAQFATFRNTLEVTARPNVAAGELRPAIPVKATDTLVFDVPRKAERW